MDITKEQMELLEANTSATFCVQNGIIMYANKAALLYNIIVGSNIQDLLKTGKDEYSSFSGNCMYLSLQLGDYAYGASIQRINNIDVFTLDQDPQNSQLMAMSLAARELREPLASIVTTVERIFPKLNDDVPDYKHQFSSINRDLYRLLRIISNMSDAARYEANRVSMETIDFSALFDEIVEKAATYLEHASIKVNYSGSNQQIFGLGNRELIERAVFNLISNAAKFSSTKATINVKLAKNGKLLYFTVQDFGDGIPSVKRPTIFARYLRQPDYEDSTHGIGLGLVIVRAAATVHGGTVLIEQPEDGGTRITMSLKLTSRADTIVKSNRFHPDYLGERDHALVELSEKLPASIYQDIN